MRHLVGRLRDNIVLGVFIVALLGVALIRPAEAQESTVGNGLRITTRNELVVNPGEVQEFEVSVKNVTAAAVDAVVDFNDFNVDDNETGTVKLILDGSQSAEYSLRQYLSGPESIPLAPGEEKKVEFTVDIPDNVTPGPYFGAVRFTAVPDGVDGQTGAVLSASLGSLVLVQVPGNIVDLLSLESISAVGDDGAASLFQDAPGSVEVRLRNEGNAFSKPFGRVSIKGWNGDEVYAYEINVAEPRGNVLPGSIRKFVDQIPEDKIGSIGRYTVEANISYGDGGNVITAKSTFWVLPWGVVIGGLVGLAGLIWLVTKGIPSYNRRVVSKSKSEKVVN